MTSNYTCEKCWCVVLTKFEIQHDAWHRRMTDPFAVIG